MLRSCNDKTSYHDIIFLKGSGKPKTTLVDFAREFVNKPNPDFITDDVANGELACAKVVSTILMKAGMLDHVLVNVEQLTRYMKVLGWHETQQGHVGDIVVWDRTTEYANLHIGIVSSDDLAINNSSFDKMPIESSISERPVLYYLSPVEVPVIMKEQEAMPDAYIATEIYFTSYNPEPAQTDDTPCVGASGYDVCELKKSGVRPIALSRDLVGKGKKFQFGDKVVLKSKLNDWRCNGNFEIWDNMNGRFKNRGDIFFLERKNNIDCWATVTKL